MTDTAVYNALRLVELESRAIAAADPEMTYLGLHQALSRLDVARMDAHMENPGSDANRLGRQEGTIKELRGELDATRTREADLLSALNRGAECGESESIRAWCRLALESRAVHA